LARQRVHVATSPQKMVVNFLSLVQFEYLVYINNDNNNNGICTAPIYLTWWVDRAVKKDS